MLRRRRSGETGRRGELARTSIGAGGIRNMMREMDSRTTRRNFFRQAARVSGTAGLTASLIRAVQQAAAIEAEPGTTFFDAEHVVILMQENRSFDHLYGSLRGVRGFDDPRAVTLPDQNPVWLQSNSDGETFAPFRLDIEKSNATWLGSLPHSWRDQTDARNHGNHDRWLEAKRSGRRECAAMPFTLGYYDRADLPFYYALADAFTVCDQNFCSSLTGTTPNRLFLWTGAIRDPAQPAAAANVRNSDVTYNSPARWTTFPERMEAAGISWKIYQNELSLPTGFDDEQEAWLANFTDNPLEWFEQYQVHFSKTFRAHAAAQLERLPKQIAELDAKIAAGQPGTGEMAKLSRLRRTKGNELEWFTRALAETTPEAEARRSARQRRLHDQAFCTNTGDPDYRKLEEIHYVDGGVNRSLQAPAGDLLFQFRRDVEQGQLPAVSWLVPPERCSDHPGSPWYGAWMLSETLRILTQKPEVWKKTIFILTYDENDGYFDHVPPFTVPDPSRPESGRVSEGIDAAIEFWPLARDRQKRSVEEARGGPVGLGYRVPMVIASPWSRGGNVCSEVFDHTSVLQFLEKLLSHKKGQPIRESNISAWRRSVCGDLTSSFLPAATAVPKAQLDHPNRNAVLRQIHQARFRQLPSGYRALSKEQVELARREPRKAGVPRQESGSRLSLAIPYQLYASGRLTGDRKAFAISLRAAREFFGDRSAGSPFHVYTPGRYRGKLELRTRAYAVEAGAQVNDTWLLEGFADERYDLRCHGPNGFYREWTGGVGDPQIEVQCEYMRNPSGQPGGDLELVVVNLDSAREFKVELVDLSYGAAGRVQTVAAGATATIAIPLSASFGWYDLALSVTGHGGFLHRFAGHVETGRPSRSDPAIGRT